MLLSNHYNEAPKIMNGTKKHSFYLLVICTVVMFGIAAYLLVSGGSSHGTIWGGRYGDKLEGTINGYGVLMIAVGMLFLHPLMEVAEQAERLFHFNGRSGKHYYRSCRRQTSQRVTFLRILECKDSLVCEEQRQWTYLANE